MARKYTKAEAFIMQRHETGETYREIGISLELNRTEVRDAAKTLSEKGKKD